MLNKCQPQNRTKYEKLCVVSVKGFQAISKP